MSQPALGFPYEHSAGRSFSEVRGPYALCLDHVLLQSIKSNEARLRDGSFDRCDVDQGIFVEWKMHHADALSKNVESQVV